MITALTTFAAIAVSAAMAPLAEAAGTKGEDFCFGHWGDMPYIRNGDVTDSIDKPQNVVRSMDKAGVAFSIFNGDIKDGGSPCGYVDGEATDDYGVFQYAYDLFESADAPVVYTPGDNEWTDCHRESNDNDPDSPLAMLEFIREFFFSSVTGYHKSYALGGSRANRLQMRHQDGQIENTRWIYGDVVFVNLHVVGSNNNNAVTDGEKGDNCGRDDTDSCALQVAEYEARTEMNLAWLEKAFTFAKRRSAKGVVVTWHGNPGFDVQDTYDTNEAAIGATDGSNGFSSTLEGLFTEIKNFDGEVLLLHGDSHNYRADQPFAASGYLDTVWDGAPALDNFMRIMAPGSPTTNWVEICVDPSDEAAMLFSHSVVAVKENHDVEWFGY